jgi:uncharacterized membrane protein YeiH
MFNNAIIILDWVGVVVFALTGALVASRHQMDVIGFMVLGTITGIGGGTVRDLLLDTHPILWIERPTYLVVCATVSVVAFFTAHLIQSRYRWILWLDAAGLALFAATGAERALSAGAGPLVAVIMGMITACFGGIIRDTLSHERSIIFSYEIYMTAALVSAGAFVLANAFAIDREAGVAVAFILGFLLRGGAIQFGWSLPRYRSRPPRKAPSSAPPQ